MPPKPIILFDLDGTLLDTAPDIIHAIHQIATKYGKPIVPFETLRPLISQGLHPLIQVGLGIEATHPTFHTLHNECREYYHAHSTQATTLFAGMSVVLKYLNDHAMPWGIVTNKLTVLTQKILENLQLAHQTMCVVCGDTLATCKPDPAPILHACHLLQGQPEQCLYVGDAEIDVLASKRAGVKVLVALYGYCNTPSDPLTWQADGYIHKPEDILEWL